MKRLIFTLALLFGIGQFSINEAHAQCPLFRLKPLLEEQCPEFTTDTTSLHARTTTPNGYEYGMNYRALRLDAPRSQVSEALVHRLFDEFLATMRLATTANHYESHHEAGDTISFTLTHGDLKGLLASIDREAFSRDTLWSASLTITPSSVRFLALSTWNARVLSIPLPPDIVSQLNATEPKKETLNPDNKQ